jgi:hypothetical protein
MSSNTGFMLNQNAFQADVLIAPVLSIITTADPLVSIGVAHAWLGETITSTPLALAGEIISLIVMTGRDRRPGLSRPARRQQQPGTRQAPPGQR